MGRKILFAQINKGDALFLKSGRWPRIALDVIAGMTCVIEVIKIVYQLGKSLSRPKMI
jgi:hypothetical protein